ncbi:MAG: FkbM family methyltransferase [Methyloligellaceae bacterium]
MIRDEQTSIEMRKAVNKVILATNNGDWVYVRKVGPEIWRTYFSDFKILPEELDVLEALAQVFHECDLRDEYQRVAKALKNRPKAFVLPKGDTHFLPFVENGKYQIAQRLAAYKYVHEWDLALDVGAHVGFWTNCMAARFESVHSFEPNPETLNCLIQNKASNVVAHNFALGDCDRASFLALPEGGNKTTSSGAWEISDDEDKAFYPIEIRTMDSLGLAPNFIKIDVQGFELQVLEGALETIMRHRPIIIVEMVVH